MAAVSAGLARLGDTADAIDPARSVRRAAATTVKDVRLDLLTDLVNSLDKMGWKDRAPAADRTDGAKRADWQIGAVVEPAERLADRLTAEVTFEPDDRLDTSKDWFDNDRYQPGAKEAASLGRLAFVMRDYAENR